MEARLQALTAAFHTPMAAARDARYQGDVVGSTRVSSSFDGDVLRGQSDLLCSMSLESPHHAQRGETNEKKLVTSTHVSNNRSKRLLKTAPALPRHIEAYLQPQGTKVVEDGQNSEDACFNVLAPTGAHEAGYAAQKVAELQQQLAVVTRELQEERARQAVTTQVSISLCYARPTR